MESALYGVYTLVVLYQKSHSFASLTCSISDTPQLLCKHRTRALSMKYSIYIPLHFGATNILGKFCSRVIVTLHHSVTIANSCNQNVILSVFWNVFAFVNTVNT